MKRVDINTACAFATHLKAMNVVAHRGKGVNSTVRHHLVAGLPHAERFPRSVVWSLANYFKVTEPRDRTQAALKAKDCGLV